MSLKLKLDANLQTDLCGPPTMRYGNHKYNTMNTKYHVNALG